MAKCDQGYLCDVCGAAVDEITDSDLYLRYIIGEVNAFQLHSAPERHILCNPTLAQFIVTPEFDPVVVAGVFAKSDLDAADVARREDLVTRGWQRLQQVRGLGIPIAEYPLSNS